MGIHTGSTSHCVGQVEDSSMGSHNGSTSYWVVDQVEDSSLGIYTGSTSHWIEASLKYKCNGYNTIFWYFIAFLESPKDKAD